MSGDASQQGRARLGSGRRDEAELTNLVNDGNELLAVSFSTTNLLLNEFTTTAKGISGVQDLREEEGEKVSQPVALEHIPPFVRTDLDNYVRLVNNPSEMVHKSLCARVLEHDARVERHEVGRRLSFVGGGRVKVRVVRSGRGGDVGKRAGSGLHMWRRLESA